MAIPTVKESLAGIEHNLARISKKLTTANNHLENKPVILSLSESREISGVSNVAFKSLCTGVKNNHGFTMPVCIRAGNQVLIDQTDLIEWIVLNRAAIDTYIKTRHTTFAIPV